MLIYKKFNSNYYSREQYQFNKIYVKSVFCALLKDWSYTLGRQIAKQRFSK